MEFVVDKKKIEEFMTYDLMSFKNKKHQLFNEVEINEILSRYQTIRLEVPSSKINPTYTSTAGIYKGYFNKLCDSFPKLLSILEIDPNCISLCGGSLYSVINFDASYNGFSYCTDVDIFFHGCTEEKADNLLGKIIELFDDGDNWNKMIYRSRYCVTIQTHRNKYQFVLRLYDREDHILGGFDLWASRFGYNLSRGLYATAHGIFCLLTKSQPVDLSKRSLTYEKRLQKYHGYKYISILFPGFIEQFPKDHGARVKFPAGEVDYRYYNYNNTGVFHIHLNTYINKLHMCDYSKMDELAHEKYFYKNNKYSLVVANKLLKSDDAIDDSFIFKSKKPFLDISDEVIKSSIGDFMNIDPSKHEKGTRPYNTEIKEIAKIPITRINSFFRHDPELLRTFKLTCYIDEDDDVMIQCWKQMQEYYLELGRVVARRWNKERWITVNPGRQGFGSFNPIIADPRVWYGPNYDPVNAGVHPEVWKVIQLCRRDNPYWCALPKDVFRIIMNLIIQIECPF